MILDARCRILILPDCGLLKLEWWSNECDASQYVCNLANLYHVFVFLHVLRGLDILNSDF